MLSAQCYSQSIPAQVNSPWLSRNILPWLPDICDPVAVDDDLSDCDELPPLTDSGTQAADNHDLVVPDGAEVINIPLPDDGTR